MNRKPYDEGTDDDLREHGYIAVYHSDKSNRMMRDAIGLCYGTGPAVNYRPGAVRRLADQLEDRDDEVEYLDKVPDPDSLAADLRELADTVEDSNT